MTPTQTEEPTVPTYLTDPRDAVDPARRLVRWGAGLAAAGVAAICGVVVLMATQPADGGSLMPADSAANRGLVVLVAAGLLLAGLGCSVAAAVRRRTAQKRAGSV